MKFIEYPDREMLAIELAQVLAGALTAALTHRDTVSFAVPGGTTPGPVFDALCAASLEWDRVHVLLTDERWVPQDDPRSNARLVRQRLLVNRAQKAHLLPLHASGRTPTEAAEALAAAIAPRLPISVLLLGMGADMHTASLFPGADNLLPALDDDAPILMPMRAPGVPESRITLTAPVLKGALATHLVIVGTAKRTALERAHSGHDPMSAPIAALLPGATVHWAR